MEEKIMHKPLPLEINFSRKEDILELINNKQYKEIGRAHV